MPLVSAPPTGRCSDFSDEPRHALHVQHHLKLTVPVPFHPAALPDGLVLVMASIIFEHFVKPLRHRRSSDRPLSSPLEGALDLRLHLELNVPQGLDSALQQLLHQEIRQPRPGRVFRKKGYDTDAENWGQCKRLMECVVQGFIETQLYLHFGGQ
ncbi:hypothetical protein J5N97_013450 [Dioscorea zingiberensis]|uniref:Uncharacterized protein n=1 Tax=Dioscorea zingiberensis TaxID=325984 RepID=A0A9D5CQK6_9LILI|nr:hypothetical protein J5N97_013450 [Dioscorea zingiberensis]